MPSQLLILAIAIFCAMQVGATGTTSAGKPNILYIAVDDLRPDLGCYGNELIHSPNIDRIAREGLVINRAYCQQAVCSPSRTSTLTGTRPDPNKVRDLETHFRRALPEVVALPQHCKNHGYFRKLGEHDAWAKHSNVENDTRVPLLVSAPGMKAAGKRTDALVELVDLYPRLADLAGLPLPEHLEGRSFKPLLDDPLRKWKSAVYSQYPRRVGKEKFMGYSMRTDRYRFTRWVNAGDHTQVDAVELYDHRSDPQANTNVANEPANKELVDSLTKQWLAGWKAENETKPAPNP